jgi:L-lysine exporter family protein LysE/ArgO
MPGLASSLHHDPDSHPSLAFPVFVQGLALSLGLIVAIGAQNAFVLRQGLRREHVGSVVLFCAVADAVLIAAGVLGMAQALGESPRAARTLALAGAVFLAVYGWQALRRARHAHQLTAAAAGEGLRRGAAVAQATAFTLLNPHVYLDTVLLVGSIGAQQPATLPAGSSRAPAAPACCGLRCSASGPGGWHPGLPGPGRGRCWTG